MAFHEKKDCNMIPRSCTPKLQCILADGVPRKEGLQPSKVNFKFVYRFNLQMAFHEKKDCNIVMAALDKVRPELADGVPRKEGLQRDSTRISKTFYHRLADGVPRKEGLQQIDLG